MEMQVELKKEQETQGLLFGAMYARALSSCVSGGSGYGGGGTLCSAALAQNLTGAQVCASCSDPSEWAQWPGESAQSDPSEWAQWPANGRKRSVGVGAVARRVSPERSVEVGEWPSELVPTTADLCPARDPTGAGHVLRPGSGGHHAAPLGHDSRQHQIVHGHVRGRRLCRGGQTDRPGHRRGCECGGVDARDGWRRCRGIGEFRRRRGGRRPRTARHGSGRGRTRGHTHLLGAGAGSSGRGARSVPQLPRVVQSVDFQPRSANRHQGLLPTAAAGADQRLDSYRLAGELNGRPGTTRSSFVRRHQAAPR